MFFHLNVSCIVQSITYTILVSYYPYHIRVYNRKRLIQEMDLTQFTASEVEKFAKVMTLLRKKNLKL